MSSKIFYYKMLKSIDSEFEDPEYEKRKASTYRRTLFHFKADLTTRQVASLVMPLQVFDIVLDFVHGPKLYWGQTSSFAAQKALKLGDEVSVDAYARGVNGQFTYRKPLSLWLQGLDYDTESYHISYKKRLPELAEYIGRRSWASLESKKMALSLRNDSDSESLLDLTEGQ